MTDEKDTAEVPELAPAEEQAPKEGRIARHTRLTREAWEQPRVIAHWGRDWLVRLWITKGGGFYGIGYVIAFVTLEIRSLTGDVSGSESVSDFITSQFIQYIVRFSVESFMNALLSVFWPAFLLGWPYGLGLVTLAVAYIAYRFVIDPFLEARIPELREARAAKAASAQAPTPPE